MEPSELKWAQRGAAAVQLPTSLEYVGLHDTGTFSSRVGVARTHETDIMVSSHDAQGGEFPIFFVSLCVALRSNVRPLAHILNPTPHISNINTS